MKFALVGCGALLFLPLALVVAAFVLVRHASEPYKFPNGPVASVEPVTTFAGFPLYWLGRSYAGLDLTDAHVQVENTHDVMYLSYGYGECSNRGWESHCRNPPVTLRIQAACGVPRLNYTSADLGAGYVWTADVAVSIQIQSPGPRKADLIPNLTLANPANFPDAPLVDSKTYDAKLRGKCGDGPPAPPTPIAAVATHAALAAGNWHAYLDCDPNTPGVQVKCTIAKGDANDVVVGIRNDTAIPVRIGSFEFTIFDPDTSIVHSTRAPFATGFICPPAPASATGSRPGTSASVVVSCAAGHLPIPPGGSVDVATVTYAGVAPGSVVLQLRDMTAVSDEAAQRTSCKPVPPSPPTVNDVPGFDEDCRTTIIVVP